MIRILAFLVLLASLAPSALAADTAERRIIGFSPDGQWFAFEEYGIADGTGAPYASIYVINTDKDIWAPGTPVRASFGEEPGPVSKALAAVHKKAGPVLERYSIREPGILLASKPVTMISTNARRIDFFRNRNVTGPAKR
ncbi:MAG TPA: DUF2259 domain-containing protein, partial [Rhizobiales bacterium]|nr:DUF2259 domain-containing protein [Hyphomicrobiales bacterium]